MKTIKKVSVTSVTENSGQIIDSLNTSDDRHTNAPSIDAVNGGLAGKSNTGHTHDDRYYTESEVDTKLNGKSNTNHTHLKSQIVDFAHTHPKSQITDFPTTMSNPNPLTIFLNGVRGAKYDGSEADSVDITPSSIGAKPSNYFAVVSGTVTLSSGTGSCKVSYPSGFTKDNCVPISIGVAGLIASGVYDYFQCASSYTFGARFLDDGINLSCAAIATSSKSSSHTIKCVLMRIS